MKVKRFEKMPPMKSRKEEVNHHSETNDGGTWRKKDPYCEDILNCISVLDDVIAEFDDSFGSNSNEKLPMGPNVPAGPEGRNREGTSHKYPKVHNEIFQMETEIFRRSKNGTSYEILFPKSPKVESRRRKPSGKNGLKNCSPSVRPTGGSFPKVSPKSPDPSRSMRSSRMNNLIEGWKERSQEVWTFPSDHDLPRSLRKTRNTCLEETEEMPYKNNKCRKRIENVFEKITSVVDETFEAEKVQRHQSPLVANEQPSKAKEMDVPNNVRTPQDSSTLSTERPGRNKSLGSGTFTKNNFKKLAKTNGDEVKICQLPKFEPVINHALIEIDDGYLSMINRSETNFLQWPDEMIRNEMFTLDEMRRLSTHEEVDGDDVYFSDDSLDGRCESIELIEEPFAILEDLLEDSLTCDVEESHVTMSADTTRVHRHVHQGSCVAREVASAMEDFQNIDAKSAKPCKKSISLYIPMDGKRESVVSKFATRPIPAFTESIENEPPSKIPIRPLPIITINRPNQEIICSTMAEYLYAIGVKKGLIEPKIRDSASDPLVFIEERASSPIIFEQLEELDAGGDGRLKTIQGDASRFLSGPPMTEVASERWEDLRTVTGAAGRFQSAILPVEEAEVVKSIVHEFEDYPGELPNEEESMNVDYFDVIEEAEEAIGARVGGPALPPLAGTRSVPDVREATGGRKAFKTFTLPPNTAAPKKVGLFGRFKRLFLGKKKAKQMKGGSDEEEEPEEDVKAKRPAWSPFRPRRDRGREGGFSEVK